MSDRIDQAIAGTLPWADLTPGEAAAANAQLDAAIRESAEASSLGAEALARGETIVTLVDGVLTSTEPDDDRRV